MKMQNILVMVSHYIGKKKVIQVTREQARACLIRKWAKLEHKILFDNKLKLGSCSKKKKNEQAWTFNTRLDSFTTINGSDGSNGFNVLNINSTRLLNGSAVLTQIWHKPIKP